MTITRNFKLCLNAGTQNAPYINANQYDEGEEWVFDLYTEGGQKFIPSTGAIIGIKSDGNAILNSGTVNASGQVVITETQQMTAASGLAVFELLIEGETHGTANFIVNVERRPSDDAEFSDSDLSMLQEAIDAAEVINEILDEGGDPSEIIEENVNAWLDNHPEATTTVVDGAITAPKINNSLWDKILVNEEASGAVASFDDGADDVPVSSLKVALEPVQLGSGDPSPTNIRPIIASNGKNLLQNNATSQTINGVTFTVNADKSITVVGTPTTSFYYNINGTAGGSALFYLTAGTTYTFSGANFQLNGTTSKAASDNPVTYTASSGDYVSYAWLYLNNGQAVNRTLYPQCNIGSSVSPYQPYQSIMVERTGKNLWKFNNSYTLSAAGSWLAVDASRSFPLKAGTYTWSFNALQAIDTIQMYFRTANDVSKTVSFYVGTSTGTGKKSYTFTLDEDVAILRSAYCNGAMSIEDIQIVRGSEATEYEPFTFTSYPISLGREVYGGTVDLATGVLTVDRVYHTVTEYSNWVYSTDSNFFYRTFNNKRAGLSNVISDEYETKQRVTWASDDDAVISGNKTTGQIYIRDTRFTSAADFIANVTASICYELDEPQTIQLTPTQVNTLLGYNNISSSGTIDVIYHADTKLYIDKRIAELG